MEYDQGKHANNKVHPIRMTDVVAIELMTTVGQCMIINSYIFD